MAQKTRRKRRKKTKTKKQLKQEAVIARWGDLVDLAWLTGMLEVVGEFQLDRTVEKDGSLVLCPMVSIKSDQFDVVCRISRIWGVNPEKIEGLDNGWSLTIKDDKAMTFMEDIYPYLGMQKKEETVGIRFGYNNTKTSSGTAKYRPEVIKLHKTTDLNYNEIAKEVGISNSTVSKIVQGWEKEWGNS